MAIIAPLPMNHTPGEAEPPVAMLPTNMWEWNTLRDGDLKSGAIAVFMVVHYDPNDPIHRRRDTPVVVDEATKHRWGMGRMAMRIVEATMGVVAVNAVHCLTPEQYDAYRKFHAVDPATGVTRPLQLPVDAEAA